MMTRMSFFLLSSAVFLTSCGQSATKVFSAPKTESQTGFIATCATEVKAQEIAVKYNGQYRIINEQRKVIEFIAISPEILKQELPKSKLFKNILASELIQNDSMNTFSTEPSFVSVSSTATRKSSYQSYFNHLVQIDAFSLPSNAQGANVMIAVIDTGVSYNHPHLNSNIWINPGEVAGNGIDDDGNGYVDDQIGWDFVNHDHLPMDDNGHGSHVSGLAAGILSGVAPSAKIIPLKVLDENGSGDVGTITAGILYAINKGVHVINLSLGGASGAAITSDVQNLINAVTNAGNHGSLIVAASGNGGSDQVGDCNDALPVYPANAPGEMVLSVAAVDSKNALASYSNFGVNSVDIAAPGGSNLDGGLLSTDIYTCTSRCSDFSSYTYKMGTSMSTPIVSGLAAVVKSFRPDLSMKQVRQVIMESGISVEGLKSKISSGKVINAATALTVAASK